MCTLMPKSFISWTMDTEWLAIKYKYCSHRLWVVSNGMYVLIIIVLNIIYIITLLRCVSHIHYIIHYVWETHTLAKFNGGRWRP